MILNVTYAGQSTDFQLDVDPPTSDNEVLDIAASCGRESMRWPEMTRTSLNGFVVDRVGDDRVYVRPKVPFGTGAVRQHHWTQVHYLKDDQVLLCQMAAAIAGPMMVAAIEFKSDGSHRRVARLMHGESMANILIDSMRMAKLLLRDAGEPLHREE